MGDKPILPARDYVAIYRAALLRARLGGDANEIEAAVKVAVNAALEDAETQCVELGHRKRIRGLMYEP